ncbi:hypothetical protein BKA93DRAFT_492095 [Sparassis latifolia]
MHECYSNSSFGRARTCRLAIPRLPYTSSSNFARFGRMDLSLWYPRYSLTVVWYRCGGGGVRREAPAIGGACMEMVPASITNCRTDTDAVTSMQKGLTAPSAMPRIYMNCASQCDDVPALCCWGSRSRSRRPASCLLLTHGLSLLQSCMDFDLAVHALAPNGGSQQAAPSESRKISQS